MSREGTQGLWRWKQNWRIVCRIMWIVEWQGTSPLSLKNAFSTLYLSGYCSPSLFSFIAKILWRVYPYRSYFFTSHLLLDLLLFSFCLLFINCYHQDNRWLPCSKQDKTKQNNRSFSVLFNPSPSFDMLSFLWHFLFEYSSFGFSLVYEVLLFHSSGILPKSLLLIPTLSRESQTFL